MKNNISLVSILALFIGVMGIVFLIFFITILNDVQSQGIEERIATFIGFLFICLLILSAIGLFLKRNWGRIIALSLTILIIIAWTGWALTILSNVRNGFREEFYIFIGINIFVFSFLIGTILFLNNDIVKKELV